MIINPYSFGVPAPTDPSFTNVSLLCHFDGTNGQTTTVDSSSFARTVTGVSGLSLSTAQTKFGASSSDHSGAGGTAAWSVADSADFDFGSGQFTIEGFIRFKTYSSANIHALYNQYPGSGTDNACFFGPVLGTLAFYYSTTGLPGSSVGAAWAPSTGVWYHIAVDRDASNVVRTYVDGVVKSTNTVAATIFNSSLPPSIGGASPASRLDGYLDEVRVTKGVARYAGAFTAPTAAFPNS